MLDDNLLKLKLKEFSLTESLLPRNATRSMAAMEELEVNREHRMIFLVRFQTGHRPLN